LRTTIPHRRIRTQESPRDARVTQALAEAINHEQIMEQYPGEIAAGRPATPEELPGTNTRRARHLTESPRENLKTPWQW